MIRRLVLALAAAGLLAASAEAAPRRVVSLDYCADQHVLALVPRDRIAALSPDAARPFSYLRAEARGLRRAQPTAEAVLALGPDLVVRSYGGGPGAAALFARAGVPVLEIGFADDIPAIRAETARIARALGAEAAGAELIAQLDQALAAPLPAGPRPSALYVAQGGVTTGPGSLIHALLEVAGYQNFETAPGWRAAPLERLARERPDVFVTAFFEGGAGGGADSWSAARHPVLRRALREGRVVRLDGAWVACGGWFAHEAVTALKAARP